MPREPSSLPRGCLLHVPRVGAFFQGVGSIISAVASAAAFCPGELQPGAGLASSSAHLRGNIDSWNLIQVPGVAVDSRGHVLVLHRGAHPILVFDTAGKFIRSWGDGMFSEGKVAAVAARDRAPGASGYSAVYGPAGCDSCGVHSIRIDAAGNIWVVDAPVT